MPWDPANSDPVGYTVAGTLNVLRAASKELSIKRVVLASSIVAAGYPEGQEPFKFDTGKGCSKYDWKISKF
jgi:nucleoside-diphosphate-sugar epimerase